MKGEEVVKMDELEDSGERSSQQSTSLPPVSGNNEPTSVGPVGPVVMTPFLSGATTSACSVIQTPITPSQPTMSLGNLSTVENAEKVPYNDSNPDLIEDIIDYNLEVLFVSVTPSALSAKVGHHNAGPFDHFYECLKAASIVSELLTYHEDRRLLNYRMGSTHVLGNTTQRMNELSRRYTIKGYDRFIEKLRKYQPKIIAINGTALFKHFLMKNVAVGLQKYKFGGVDAHVFVLPSSKARCAYLPRVEDKLPIYKAFQMFREYVMGKRLTMDFETRFDDYGKFRVSVPNEKARKKYARRKERLRMKKLQEATKNATGPLPALPLAVSATGKGGKAGKPTIAGRRQNADSCYPPTSVSQLMNMSSSAASSSNYIASAPNNYNFANQAWQMIQAPSNLVLVPPAVSEPHVQFNNGGQYVLSPPSQYVSNNPGHQFVKISPTQSPVANMSSSTQMSQIDDNQSSSLHYYNSAATNYITLCIPLEKWPEFSANYSDMQLKVINSSSISSQLCLEYSGKMS